MGNNENKIKLSILIPTIPERADKLKRLEDILRPQLPIDNSVELIISEELPARNGGPTIGAHRNAMLELAIGEYVCFVDDDDIVSEDYVEQIMKAIDRFYMEQSQNVLNGEEGSLVSAIKSGGPDCVGIKGHYIKGKNIPESFIHSIDYGDWFSTNGEHYRPPTHLNPVKLELALQVKFPDKNQGEDRDYSLALRKLLKTEVMIDEPIYVYYK